MTWVVENWPVVLLVAGGFVLITGLIRKLIKLAVFGVILTIASAAFYMTLL